MSQKTNTAKVAITVPAALKEMADRAATTYNARTGQPRGWGAATVLLRAIQICAKNDPEFAKLLQAAIQEEQDAGDGHKQ